MTAFFKKIFGKIFSGESASSSPLPVPYPILTDTSSVSSAYIQTDTSAPLKTFNNNSSLPSNVPYYYPNCSCSECVAATMGKRSSGHGGGAVKQKERLKRDELKKERRRKEYSYTADARELIEFNGQLAPLGLCIYECKSDGNCLFRALADQIDHNENLHHEYRFRILNYIEQHREDFEFFIEDDEGFDPYMRRMRQDAAWGGNLELQAASMLFGVNIVIHQLRAPRLEMMNHPFPPAAIIHLTYFDGEHYNSTRVINPQVAMEIAKASIPAPTLADSSSSSSSSDDTPQNWQEEVILQSVQCRDLPRIRELLKKNWNNVDSVINQLLEEEEKASKEKESEEAENLKLVEDALLQASLNDDDDELKHAIEMSKAIHVAAALPQIEVPSDKTPNGNALIDDSPVSAPSSSSSASSSSLFSLSSSSVTPPSTEDGTPVVAEAVTEKQSKPSAHKLRVKKQSKYEKKQEKKKQKAEETKKEAEQEQRLQTAVAQNMQQIGSLRI